MERTTVIDIPSFASTQIHLLTHELNVSLEESRFYLSYNTPKILQRAGLALTNLVSVAQRTGLGGKTIIELASDAATGDEDALAPHSLRGGDIVALAEQPVAVAARKAIGRDPAKAGARGVVVKVTKSRVSVILEEKEPLTPAERQENEVLFSGQRRVWLVRLADEVTHKRMKETMERLGRMGEREYSQLIQVTFALNTLSPTDEVLVTEWFDTTLNQSQKEAVQFGLGRPDVALIHGPPGTGKTHTLIELILQLLKRQLRVLVCGPSNISVDNIMERLAPHKVALTYSHNPLMRQQ
ncbi:Bgt-5213 [Blumeria graminis f. sp. tritici]|uniref:DNA helicase n=2 Tax=Blumeria graminis f. sp. tritici TaxID=62690 RepID=A0A061HL67_BLUGR|nr:Hexameric DNA polymerase alpha-associated DNA helicase A [Blumeria graminis f. sp. tritici 96224]VDB90870.1 Bgt-5213 [Blumeria graminis f. sp. tritici]